MGAQGTPVEIHAFLSITGFNAFIGSAYAQTLKIVEKHVNATGGIRGRPVRFVEHDDQSNPQIDIQLLAPLLAAHVPVIIHSGPVVSCNALRPLIEAAAEMHEFASFMPRQYCQYSQLWPEYRRLRG